MSTEAGPFQHVIRFTTETASAHNRAGTKEVSVAGMRGEPTARYVQLVGATTNPKLSYPKPGAAVYVVLSGTFDVLPDGS